MLATSTLHSHNDTDPKGSVHVPTVHSTGAAGVAEMTHNGSGISSSRMLLPSENILDVLHCVDFATLLALQRSGSAFYDVVHRNQSILPRLRVFGFYLDLASGDHALREIVDDARTTVLSSPEEVSYTDEFDYSMLHPFADTVGTHFVESAIIVSTGDPMRAMKFDMRKAVEALPALKHVRELIFECRCMMHTTYDIDMKTVEELILSPLDNLQRLEMGDMNSLTDWAFLRKDWALRLRSLAVKAIDLFHESGEYGQPKIDASGQAEILEYCTDFAHVETGKSKKLKIPGWRISSEFLQRIVTAVSQCKDRLTVVVDGVPGFIGNDAGYTHFEVPPENPEASWASGSVLFSSLDGSHRVVQTYHRKPMVAVTNNPFVKTWNDACMLDVEGV